MGKTLRFPIVSGVILVLFLASCANKGELRTPAEAELLSVKKAEKMEKRKVRAEKRGEVFDPNQYDGVGGFWDLF